MSNSHFKNLANFSVILENRELVIYSHQYNCLAFGSWLLEFGTTHKRFQAIWDGKDSVLTISNAVITSQTNECEWNMIQSFQTKNNDTFKKLADFFG